jgi:hypothetical protein
MEIKYLKVDGKPLKVKIFEETRKIISAVSLEEDCSYFPDVKGYQVFNSIEEVQQSISRDRKRSWY